MSQETHQIDWDSIKDIPNDKQTQRNTPRKIDWENIETKGMVNDTIDNGVWGSFVDTFDAGAANVIGGTARFAETFSPVGKGMFGSIADDWGRIARRNTPMEELQGANWVSGAVGNAVGSGAPSLAIGTALVAISAAFAGKPEEQALAAQVPAGVATRVYHAMKVNPVYKKLAETTKRMWSSPFGKLALGEAAGSGIEAMAEGGALIDEMRNEGFSDEEIRTAALTSAGLNTAWLTVANLVGGKLMADFGEEAVKGGLKQMVKNAGKGALREGASEGVQETGQSYIGDFAKGSDFDHEQAMASALQAFVGSGILGGLGGAAAPYIKPDKKTEGTEATPETPKTETPKTETTTTGEQSSAPVEQPTDTIQPITDVNQARNVLDGYRDGLGAGEEYNQISDLLNTGSDEDIIKKAQTVLDMQREAAKLERDDAPVEEPPTPSEPPVETPTTPSTPVVELDKNLSPEKQLINLEKTLKRIAENKINGINQISDDVVQQIETAIADKNYGDMLNIAKKLGVKRSKELQKYVKDLKKPEPTVAKNATDGGNDNGTIDIPTQGAIDKNPENPSDNGKPQENVTTPSQNQQNGGEQVEEPPVEPFKFNTEVGDYAIDEAGDNSENAVDYIFKGDEEKEVQRIARIERTKDGKFKAWKNTSDKILGDGKKFDSLEDAEAFIKGEKKNKPVEAPVQPPAVERNKHGRREKLGEWKVDKRATLDKDYHYYKSENEDNINELVIARNDDDTYRVVRAKEGNHEQTSTEVFETLEEAEAFAETGKRKKSPLKLFKALVKDKETKRTTVMVRAYKTKKNFVSDLTGNGYAVSVVAEYDKYYEAEEKWETDKKIKNAIAKAKRESEKYSKQYQKKLDELTEKYKSNLTEAQAKQVVQKLFADRENGVKPFDDEDSLLSSLVDFIKTKHDELGDKFDYIREAAHWLASRPEWGQQFGFDFMNNEVVETPVVEPPTNAPSELPVETPVIKDTSFDAYIEANVDDPILLAIMADADGTSNNTSDNATDDVSDQDDSLDTAINQAEIEDEIDSADEMPEDVESYIKTLKGKVKTAATKWFKAHPERIEYCDDVAYADGLRVFVKGAGKNATYFVKTADADEAEVKKVEADAILAISGAELEEKAKELTAKELKDLEKSKYISEIPLDAYDDYLDTLDESTADAYATVLDDDCSLEGHSEKTLQEVVRECAFSELANPNEEQKLWDKLTTVYARKKIKFNGKEISCDEALWDFYDYCKKEYKNKVKNTSKGSIEDAIDLTRGEGIKWIASTYPTLSREEEIALYDYIKSKDKKAEVNKLTKKELDKFKQEFEESKESNESTEKKVEGFDVEAFRKETGLGAIIDSASNKLDGMKFKLKEENSEQLEEFDADLLGNLVYVGKTLLEKYQGTQQAWTAQMELVFAQVREKAAKFLNSVWAYLKKLPQNIEFDLKTAISSIAIAGKYRGNDKLKKAIKNSASPMKDYIDSAFAAIKHYPRRGNTEGSVVQLNNNNQEGGNNNVNVRVAGPSEGGSDSRRTGQPVEISSGTSDGGTTQQSEATNIQGNNATRGMGTGKQDVSGAGADTGGARGNQQGGEEISDDTGRGSRNPDNSGGNSGGNGRNAFNVDAELQTRTGATSEVRPANASAQRGKNEGNLRLARQQEINNQKSVKVQAGDLANIAETLPVLYEGQHSDIRNAEKRLYVDGGKGMLVADGTGCGKTLVGLGLIKRANWQGKKNILVVVPTSDIAKAWHNDGKLLGYTDDDFVDITTNGFAKDKINVITYASLYQNKDLINNKWDLILCDESHHLASGEQSTEESPAEAVLALRGITGHHDGYEGWFKLKHRDELAERKALRSKVDVLIKKMKIGDTSSAVERQFKELNAKHKLLDDKIRNLRRNEETLFKQHQEKVASSKVLFLSATPFAYAENVYLAEGYLFDYSDFGGNYRALMTGRFNYQVTQSGKLRSPVKAGLTKNNNTNEWAFHDFLIGKGAMSKRSLEIDQDYNRQFIKVQPGVASEIDRGLKTLERHFAQSGLYENIMGIFNYWEKRRLCEAIKAQQAIPMIKEYLQQGKQVVLFHDTKIDTPIPNPFDISEEQMKDWSDDARNDYLKFKSENQELLALNLGNLKPPIEIIRDAFGKDLMTINGATSKESKREASDVFQGKKPFDESKDDITKGKLIMLTVDAGKEGISLHDTSEGGRIPRVLISLGMPTKPTDVIQMEGRIYRYGQTSNAQFRYLTTGTAMENKAFMERISTRSKTAENFALGDSARKLDLRLILGYMKAEAGGVTFNALQDNDNAGGKVDDRRSAEELQAEVSRLYGYLDDYTRAKAQEIFDRELANDESYIQKMLSPENEGLFVATLKDCFNTNNVKKVEDGVWVAKLANGNELWVDLNNSSVEIVSAMSAQQQEKAKAVGGINTKKFTVSGLYGKDIKDSRVIDIIRLTEAADSGTLYHETFHFILNVLATKSEREAILRYYLKKLQEKKGLVNFNKMTKENQLRAAEELACDDYAAFVKKDKAPKNLLDKLFWKIKKFLAKWLDNFGGHAPLGMYVKARQGEYFKRQAEQQANDNANKYQLKEVEEIQPEPLKQEKQADGTTKYSMEPTDVVDNKMARDLVAGTLAEANAYADQKGQEKGVLKVYEKAKSYWDMVGKAPLFELIKSPSRMAEKYPVFKSFYNIFLKAQETQEKLREQWNKRFNGALALLKNDVQFGEFIDIMVSGEYEGKDYTAEELKAMGYSDPAIFAYRRSRKLLDAIWKQVNDAHRGLKEYTKVVGSKELRALKEDKFIENLMVQEAHSDTFLPITQVKIIPGMQYKITYNKPKVYKSLKQLTKEQLDELRNDPYAKVHKVEEVFSIGANIKYYEARVEQTPKPIGKLTGYIPHIFEQWMVLVETEDGLRPIHSSKTLKEAIAEGAKIQEANPKLNVMVQPKLFKPDEFLGGVDGEGGKSSGITMSEAEFLKLQRSLIENSKMSLHEAKSALKSVVSKTGRNRFFGNIRHRKGRAGYNQDVIESINRYITMSSRYCALQPAKSEAIPLYERTFGVAFDKEPPKGMAMANVIKGYIRYNNGTPNSNELRWNDWLNNWDWWRNNMSASYGDRASIMAIGKINSAISVAKLGFFSFSAAFVNLSQLKSTYALVGEKGIVAGLKAIKRMNRLDKMVIEETGVRYNIGLDTPSGFTKRRTYAGSGKRAKAVGAIKRLRDAYSAFGDKSMILFKTTEAFLRRLTVLSAYYKGVADGMNHKEAIAYAKDVNRKANFDYGAADAPGLFRSAAGTPMELALLFQKYPMKEWEMMSTMLPLVGSGTKAQKARYWGMYFLLAGLFGFPAIDWVDEWLEDELGYKPTVLAKAWILNKFGDNAVTRMSIYGVGAGVGVDVSKRVGMAGMFPSENSLLAYLTGAFGSTVQQMASAIASGDAVKVAKAWSPALGHALEAAQGYRTNSRGQVMFEYEGLDRLLKAAGFKPVGESVAIDTQSAMYADRTRQSDAKNKVKLKIAMKLNQGEELTDKDRALMKEHSITMKSIKDAQVKMLQTTKERTKAALTKRQREEYKNLFSDR